MAIATAFALPRITQIALPPRDARAATAWRLPPRVYSPLAQRRLLRPMAVPATRQPGRPGR